MFSVAVLHKEPLSSSIGSRNAAETHPDLAAKPMTRNILMPGAMKP